MYKTFTGKKDELDEWLNTQSFDSNGRIEIVGYQATFHGTAVGTYLTVTIKILS